MRSVLFAVMVLIASIVIAPTVVEAGPLVRGGRAVFRAATAPIRFIGRRCCFRHGHTVRNHCTGSFCR